MSGVSRGWNFESGAVIAEVRAKMSVVLPFHLPNHTRVFTAPEWGNLPSDLLIMADQEMISMSKRSRVNDLV